MRFDGILWDFRIFRSKNRHSTNDDPIYDGNHMLNKNSNVYKIKRKYPFPGQPKTFNKIKKFKAFNLSAWKYIFRVFNDDANDEQKMNGNYRIGQVEKEEEAWENDAGVKCRNANHHENLFCYLLTFLHFSLLKNLPFFPIPFSWYLLL